MQLLFVRHAIAAPRGSDNLRDDDRPLTERGRRRFTKVAQRLVQIAPKPKAILSSPLVRARETAAIAAAAWKCKRIKIVPALADGDWLGVAAALAPFEPQDTVVLVGHEHWISTITARLLASKRAEAFRYRKGGVALIGLSSAESERGTLLWFIPPGVFRRLKG
jgi:phosphohistidine phosphatase